MSGIPFSRFKGGVTGEAFIGRNIPLHMLEESADADKPVNVAIYGLPHVGKSSVCLEWIRRMKEQGNRLKSGRPVFVLDQTVIAEENDKKENSSYCTFLRYLLTSAFSNIRRGLRERSISSDGEVEQLRDELKAYVAESCSEESLQELQARGKRSTELLEKTISVMGKQGIRTIIVLDEFERAGQHWTEEEYILFATMLLKPKLDLFCVVASRPHISYVISDYVQKVSPFKPYLLTPFDDEDMKEYFRILKQEGGPDILGNGQTQRLREILYACGRNPYLLGHMAADLIENPTESPKELYRKNRENYRIHFADVVRFMLFEEAREEKSFSHVVKCYFGTSDDYKDIIGTYIQLGYIELMKKGSPFSYVDEGHVYHNPEDNTEYYFTTVSPAFITYLHTCELDNVKDTRDLLTGLVHAIRDITEYELSKVYGMGMSGWNRAVLYRFKVNQPNGVFYAVRFPDGHWEYRSYYDLQHGFYSRGHHYPAGMPFVRNRKDWIDSHGSEMIVVGMSSLKYAILAFNSGTNHTMPVLDPINLGDNGSILKSYPVIFAPYFGILDSGNNAAWGDELIMHLRKLQDYRNQISHFSRYGISDAEKEDCKKRCIYLLNSIYSYFGDEIPMAPRSY